MTTVTNISAGQMTRTADRLARHADALAASLRLLTPPPADVIAGLEEADARHETACDVYDIATRDLDAARHALTEAARRLTEAEVEWNTAGTQMDALARHVARMRKDAGVVLTATGYKVSP